MIYWEACKPPFFVIPDLTENIKVILYAQKAIYIPDKCPVPCSMFR